MSCFSITQQVPSTEAVAKVHCAMNPFSSFPLRLHLSPSTIVAIVVSVVSIVIRIASIVISVVSIVIISISIVLFLVVIVVLEQFEFSLIFFFFGQNSVG